MDRIRIPYEPEFKSNENGYLIADSERAGEAAWTLDKHCGDGHEYPVIRCPLCCGLFSLGRHSISIDGEVNASILCLCNAWHIWGILDRWREIAGCEKQRGQMFLRDTKWVE